MKKPRNKLSKIMFGNDKNNNFKDNEEMFLFFGSLYSKPKRFVLNVVTLVGLVLSIFPFLFLSKMNIYTWIVWSLGIVFSILLEQLANYHYYKFAKNANKKDYEEVRKNITYNKIARDFSKVGIIMLVLVAALLTVSKSGTLESLW